MMIKTVFLIIGIFFSLITHAQIKLELGKFPASYVKQKQSIMVVSEQKDSLWAYYFGNDFFPAGPPTTMHKAVKSRNLTLDSLVRFQGNVPIYFDNTGLCFIQADTTGFEGTPVLVVPSDYPKFKKVDHVINPLIYIASDQEIEDVRNNSDKRNAFQAFWLDLGETEETARNLIREYYTRVTYSNEYFTSFKEGWMTDRGMIHIVFGPPDKMHQRGESIIWAYTSLAGENLVEFTFEQKSNMFSANHYTLQRSERYQKVWDKQVKRWRTAKVLALGY